MKSILGFTGNSVVSIGFKAQDGVDSFFKDLIQKSIMYWLFTCRETDVKDLYRQASDCWKGHTEFIMHFRGISGYFNHKAVLKTAIFVHSRLGNGEEKRDLASKIKIALKSFDSCILPCHFDFGV